MDASLILSALGSAVLAVDRTDTVRAFNPAAETLLNVPARYAVDRPLACILPEDHPIFAMIAGVRGQGAGRTEYDVPISTHRTKVAGAIVQLSPLGDDARTIAIQILPTGLAREIDRHIVHRGAARSMGGMAAILAHEVKNPLAGISGAAQLIEPNVEPADRELVRLIREEADRVAALVDRMESFAGPEGIVRRPLNIHEVLDRARSVAATGFGAGIAFTEAYDPSLPPIPGDRDRLVQVFLNLIRNAADACPEDGGEIEIRTVYRHGARLTVPGAAERTHLPLEVSIRDNGRGIPQELHEHLFEPFVTSKPNGQGLGLALVAKLVHDHGGAVAFESEPRRTVFRVMLPVESGEEAAR